MTLKEQLFQAIEALPSDRLAQVLTFVQSLSTKPSTTSAKSFLAHLKITQLGIGENDLWIAAVALQHQLTLVTTDQDFQRIQAVQPFDLESWL